MKSKTFFTFLFWQLFLKPFQRKSCIPTAIRVGGTHKGFLKMTRIDVINLVIEHTNVLAHSSN